jgi:hypothetical protein
MTSPRGQREILLAHEHDPNPKMRSEMVVTPEKRVEMLSLMAECTLMIYDFFRGRAKGKAKQKIPGGKKRRDVR